RKRWQGPFSTRRGIDAENGCCHLFHFSIPAWARVRPTDGVACHRGMPCRVLAGEDGHHPLPQPVQPFGRSRRGEHGVDERLVSDGEPPDAACGPRQGPYLSGLAEVGAAQTIAVAQLLQAQVMTTVARRGHQTISQKTKAANSNESRTPLSPL